MLYQVSTQSREIDLAPSTELDEIFQNVKMILTTFKGTVPMDRQFGIDPLIVDLPITLARTKATANIVEAVQLGEPRAKVKRVDFSGDVTGKLDLTVTIELDTRY